MESSFMDVSPARLKVVPRLLSASKILTLDQGFRSRQLWGSRGGRRETLSTVIRRLLRVEVLDLALFFPRIPSISCLHAEKEAFKRES